MLNRILQLDGFQTFCEWPFSIKKKAFQFSHVAFKCKLLIWAGPIAYFGWPLFKFWLKACLCMNQQILHVWYQSPNFTLELQVHVLFRLLSFQFLTFEIKLLTARLQLKWTATYETDLTSTVIVTVWQKQCIPDWKAPNGPGCRRTKLKICGSEYSMFNIFYTVIHIFKYPEFQPPPPLAKSLSRDLARGGGGWNSG